ncbi:MAG: hypothetical protein IPK19_29890 [Chloroflexi bacterium]|nr:hypothetical protein [Chloroflexota bacterium]
MLRTAPRSHSFSPSQIVLFCCVLAIALGAGVGVTAQQAPPALAGSDSDLRFVPGELLVKLSPSIAVDATTHSTNSAALDALLEGAGVVSVLPLFEPAANPAQSAKGGPGQYFKMTFSPDADVLSLADLLQDDPSVEIASPNYIGHIHLVPNDPHFPEPNGRALNNSGPAQLMFPLPGISPPAAHRSWWPSWIRGSISPTRI